MSTDPTAWSRRRFLGATLTASGLAVAGLAGCGLGRASSPDPDEDAEKASGWGGEVDVPGLKKPDVTFTDMNGKPFPFVEETKGKLALLFFGYTHCPDVCPTTMSELAEVKRSLGADGSRVVGVFVTVDPRDAYEFTPDQHLELDTLMDAVRQVNRYVVVLEPDYIDLDLEIGICTQPGSYPARVESDVITALIGPRCFLAPTNFPSPPHCAAAPSKRWRCGKRAATASRQSGHEPPADHPHGRHGRRRTAGPCRPGRLAHLGRLAALAARHPRHAVPAGRHRLVGAAAPGPSAAVVRRAHRAGAAVARDAGAVRRRAARALEGAGRAGAAPEGDRRRGDPDHA